MDNLLKLQKNLEKALNVVNEMIDKFDEEIINEDKIKSKFNFEVEKEDQFEK